MFKKYILNLPKKKKISIVSYDILYIEKLLKIIINMGLSLESEIFFLN